MKREASLSQNHLSWPFIPSKINLPLMCSYYCTDFNLLQPIRASPQGDTIHCRCVVFHLDLKQWLIKFTFAVLFKDFEGSSELCHRTLNEVCTPDETDPTQTNWKSSRSRNYLEVFKKNNNKCCIEFVFRACRVCIKAWPQCFLYSFHMHERRMLTICCAFIPLLV